MRQRNSSTGFQVGDHAWIERELQQCFEKDRRKLAQSLETALKNIVESDLPDDVLGIWLRKNAHKIRSALRKSL